MNRLAGKVALVTGGGTGIGQAIAVAFAREGAAVAICGRRSGPLDETVAMIIDAGGRATAIPGDVSIQADVDRVVQGAAEVFGRITVLVNNAALGEEDPIFHLITSEQWDAAIDTNLRGPFMVTRAVIPQMLEAGRGSIVNVISRAASMGVKGDSPAYVASKGGLLSLTRSLAVQYAEHNIRVNAISPAITMTAMSEKELMPYFTGELDIRDRAPLGRPGLPRDHAFAALYLASDEASWVTGINLPVDGGRSAV